MRRATIPWETRWPGLHPLLVLLHSHSAPHLCTPTPGLPQRNLERWPVPWVRLRAGGHEALPQTASSVNVGSVPVGWPPQLLERSDLTLHPSLCYPSSLSSSSPITSSLLSFSFYFASQPHFSGKQVPEFFIVAGTEGATPFLHALETRKWILGSPQSALPSWRGPLVLPPVPSGCTRLESAVHRNCSGDPRAPSSDR